MRGAALILAAVLGGCGANWSMATRYEPASYLNGGGYSERQLAPDKYMVTFGGNGYTPASDVKAMAYRRAQEVCEQAGFAGFDVVDKDADETGYVRTDCSAQGSGVSCASSNRTTSRSVALMVQCRNKPSEADTAKKASPEEAKEGN